MAAAGGGSWIKLNVGGTVFCTSVATLTMQPDSMLARLVSGDIPSTRDETGAILIDRDPRYFAVVLNFLRHGSVFLEGLSAEAVRAEAMFFNLTDLADSLHVSRQADFASRAALLTGKAQLGNMLLGVRLCGMDLTGLSLNGVDVTNGCLDDAILAKASLAEACLAKASACGVDFSECNLTRADARQATMLRCSFEDAVLNFANLSSCDASGCSFARASCQNTIFQQCALRGSVFTGANMTYAMLQGCDLREADFRGATLTDARFTGSDLRGALLDWATFDVTCCRGALLTEAEFARIPRSEEDRARMKLAIVDPEYRHHDEEPLSSIGARVGVAFVVAARDGLRLRRQPAGEIIRLYPEGTRALTVGEVVKTKHWWFRVRVGEEEGFFMAMYLRRAEQQPDAEAAAAGGTEPTAAQPVPAQPAPAQP